MNHRPTIGMQSSGQRGWRRIVRRGGTFSVLWLVLSGGDTGSWPIGVPAVLLASWLSLRAWPGPDISFRALLRFLPWFVRQSLAGAIDVALRALRPSMPLHPGLVHECLRLPDGAPRVAVANVISMLPGTLSADLNADILTVHALDTRQDIAAMLRDLEPRIAAIFNSEVGLPHVPGADE